MHHVKERFYTNRCITLKQPNQMDIIIHIYSKHTKFEMRMFSLLEYHSTTCASDNWPKYPNARWHDLVPILHWALHLCLFIMHNKNKQNKQFHIRDKLYLEKYLMFYCSIDSTHQFLNFLCLGRTGKIPQYTHQIDGILWIEHSAIDNRNW